MRELFVCQVKKGSKAAVGTQEVQCSSPDPEDGHTVGEAVKNVRRLRAVAPIADTFVGWWIVRSILTQWTVSQIVRRRIII